MQKDHALVSVSVLFVLAIMACLSLLIYQSSNDLISMYAEESYAALGQIKISQQAFTSLQPQMLPPEQALGCNHVKVPSGKFDTVKSICFQHGYSSLLHTALALDLSSFPMPPLFEVGASNKITCTDIAEPPTLHTLLGVSLTPSSFRADYTCNTPPTSIEGVNELRANLSSQSALELGGELHVLGYCETNSAWTVTHDLLLVCAGDVYIKELTSIAEASVTLVSISGSILVQSIGTQLNFRAIAAKGLSLPTHTNPHANTVFPNTRELLVVGLSTN